MLYSQLLSVFIQNPGFFYYSGFKNPKEDELREKKVINTKRTVDVLQSINNGIELVRTGSKYIYLRVRLS